MHWRRFNGDPIELPIKTAVEAAIVRETHAGFHLKVCIGTDSQIKGAETEFATVIVFLREAMGYILGMGFAFKAKPEAFASSSCANKVVN